MANIILSANSSWYVYHFRKSLITLCIQQGHRVGVLAPFDEYTQRLKDLGVEYYTLTMEHKGTNPFRELITVGRYWNRYRKIRPDWVLQFNPKPTIYGSLAAGLLNIPVINNISGLGSSFLSTALLKGFVTFLYRLSQQKARVVFFQNSEDQALFLAKRIVTQQQARLLPGSGVNLEFFSPPKDFLPRAHGTIFLLIARLIRDKGIYEYAQAAELIRSTYPDCRFQLLGFIDENNPTALSQRELDQWVAQGTIEYLGKTDDVRPAIAQADCVVLPSYREGTPRTLLEAAAMAKPLIAADATGTREPVDQGENGFLCTPRSGQDLARAMKDFLSLSSEQRLAMGLASRKKMEQQYDESIVLNAYREVIHGTY